MNKLQSPQYAKQNIINNYKANYTGDHQSSSDVELFLDNALDQFEKIVRSDCAYDRDKQDEAVKNLHRDYLSIIGLAVKRCYEVIRPNNKKRTLI